MPRLYRPNIPTGIKLKVVLRQVGEIFPDQVLAEAKRDRMMGRQLNGLLKMLAETLNCEVSDLRLDHDPPLGARDKSKWSASGKTYYIPDANDPEHLFYRPHGAQFEGSHDVKTRIRGDHGQFSDIALIKRQRRRERGPKPKRGPKIQGRRFEGKSRPFPKRRKS